MKQHERTHKIGTKSSNSVAGSPIIGARGSRRPSASAGGDPMELDVNDAAGGLNIGGAGFTKRPRMRSELSEIMEGLDRENGVLRGEEDMDADGEGESPGLDALATAASEMV